MCNFSTVSTYKFNENLDLFYKLVSNNQGVSIRAQKHRLITFYVNIRILPEISMLIENKNEKIIID